eukprot:CAMPEP_0116871476 /NCGR_PEP_ID=MMETSP0463-20121206/1847_1 /TAXON_ID=181622 /ORGANISM="Strombidinopsis sp, Strain SopsisLIS2011" /LENGTH=77 /DNA_ID=CAMNT_0004509977 /DNA_START=401 /DNA_END=634 /DNA_ORIENTATION=-
MGHKVRAKNINLLDDLDKLHVKNAQDLKKKHRDEILENLYKTVTKIPEDWSLKSQVDVKVQYDSEHKSNQELLEQLS